MTSNQNPPMPQGLREMLRDYPEHVQRLQDALDEYARKPFKLMPFDGAIWALEGRLETFCLEANEEVRAAEESKDPDRISRARKMKSAFGAARVDMGLLTELQDYFRQWGQQ